MSKGFIQIRRGLEEHLLAGRIGLWEAGAYLVIHLQADFRTGIWTGSAPRLLATAPRGASLRDVQRAVARLEKIDFIRVFHQHGQRGNYRVLIHKYEPQSGALKGQRLNAIASISCDRPAYESCAEDDAVPVAEAAPYLKEEQKQKEKKTPAPKPAPPVDPRHKPVFDSCFEAYRVKYGTKPTWGGREAKSLQAFLREHAGISPEEIVRRYGNLLASSERYHADKHGSLLHLLSNFDTFADGPIQKPTKGTHTNAKPTLDDIVERNSIGLGFKERRLN